VTDFLRPAMARVDEISQNRRDCPARGDVGSAVRAAGGFPTLGGGARANASAPARGDRAPRQAVV
jgi:hypothetical protein